MPYIWLVMPRLLPDNTPIGGQSQRRFLATLHVAGDLSAAVGTPIAFSLATKLGLPVEPLVLAVLFGCNLCYATPVAYQTNMLIMVEGKYEFGDDLRTGVPLVILMVVSFSVILSWTYSL